MILKILKKNISITNTFSRNTSHLLRFQNQGILTSYKTVNSDNPKLNCRLNGLEKFSPRVIVIDKNLDIKINSFVIQNVKKNKLVIFHNSKKFKKIKILKKKMLSLYV